MWYRLPSFFLLIVLGVFITPILSLPFAIFYALRWYAIELVVLGYVFDTYFGRVADWPYYTIVLAMMVLLCELAKRYLILKGDPL